MLEGQGLKVLQGRRSKTGRVNRPLKGPFFHFVYGWNYGWSFSLNPWLLKSWMLKWHKITPSCSSLSQKSVRINVLKTGKYPYFTVISVCNYHWEADWLWGVGYVKASNVSPFLFLLERPPSLWEMLLLLEPSLRTCAGGSNGSVTFTPCFAPFAPSSISELNLGVSSHLWKEP